jgi:hypothetical protein
MSQGTPAPFVRPQFFTNNGVPAVGYQLFIYTAGTSTKANTWSDSGLTTLNDNPIILDASGRADIWLDAASYKFVLALPVDSDPPASPIWSVDGVPGAGASNQPWLRVVASGYTILGTIGDKVGIGTATPDHEFSVYDKHTVDENGRLLSNNSPSYDLSSNARSADVWIDAGGAAGTDSTGYGGEFELPATGKVRDLVYVTGTLGDDDVSPSDSEFSAYRFELKNKGPNLSSAVRGIIGNVTMTAGGHCRAGYFRTTAEAAATGYMTSILAAVHAGAALTAGNAIGLFLHSTGQSGKAYAVELTNDVSSAWSAGIVFDDNFSCNIAAVRLRQSTVNGRIGWGGTISPYLESTTADHLVISAATATNTRVGIGTATPEKTLHVVGGSGEVASFPTIGSGDLCVIENNGAAGLAIITGAASVGSIKWFGSGDAAEDGQIAYSRSTRNMTFKGAATDRVRINGSTGSVLLAMAGAIATTATDGFVYMPSCAGPPTGVPTAATGMIPFVVDSTNSRAYIYSGGAWVALN